MRWSSLCVVLLGVVALLAVHASAECPPGVELQNCLVNPCDAQPCAGASRCEADYCGGCNYNCICVADEDCASGKEFCRPSSLEKGAPSYCTAYATVGESCGGFIPPPFSKQCSPDLTCVYQRFIPDAPGTCYASCKADSDCGEKFFCSTNGYCVEDGGCGESKDCVDPNNNYIVPACVGYASCEQGSCSWTCGDLPACKEDFDCPRDYLCDQSSNTCSLPADEPVPSGSCADGSEPLSCLVAPCDVNNPCSVSEACVNDYCGGCNARCVCVSDSDCVEGKEWCRTSGVPVPGELGKRVLSYCTPFAGLGESCGGFVLPAFQEICAEGLECVNLNPFIADIPGQCLSTCSEDSDCGEEFFCSTNGFCVEDGQCAVLNDCSNPNNSFISVDCVGYTTCDFGTCGITCGELPACKEDFDCSFGYHCDKETNTCAVGEPSVGSGSCADGSEPFACIAEPCFINNPCKISENCVNDYCGGCKAYCACKSDKDCAEGKEFCGAFDFSGESSVCRAYAGVGDSCGGLIVNANQCAPDLSCLYIHLFPDAPGTCYASCKADSDCGDKFFCSESGFCLEDGQCQETKDCVDPNNSYIIPACVGYSTCERGTCGFVCGTPAPCKEDFDCPSGYTCNESNTCVIPDDDNEGESPCPDGSDLFSCLVAPCDVNNPCANAEECVNDYCGGCNARCTCKSDKDCASGKEWCRPSKANDGTSVCTAFAGLGESCGGFVLPAYREICAEGLECVNLNPFIPDLPGQCLSTCSQDSDCGDEFFCSENGFCVEDGQCAVLDDCSNPNNNYASVKCVGYTTCDFGTCGITCGQLPACKEDFDCSFGYFCDKNTNTCAIGDGNENPVGECPNGLNLVQCFAEPCSVGSSCKNPKNCYSDYCGGCNTHCTCKSDKDCHSGKEWCRVADRFYQNEESGEILSFCTPFAGLGESCGGFVTPSNLRICADGLECVNLNPFIADAPGQCMSVCSEDRDCKKDSFCSTRGVCVKDGQCGSLSDCFDDNNNYPVIECVGYTTCEESSCGVTCGQAPTCREDFECPFGYACDKASASCVRSTENTCSCGAFDPSGFEICADGSLSGPVCKETADGDCSFVYRACPEDTECKVRGQCNHAIGGKCLGSCINNQCALSNFDRCYNLEAQIVLLYERIIGLRSIASPSKIADDIAKILSFPRSSIVLLEGTNGYIVVEFLQNKQHDAFEAARTLRNLIATNDASIRDSALANLDVLVINPEAEGDSSVDSSESSKKTDSGRSNSDDSSKTNSGDSSNSFSENEGNSKSDAAQLVLSVFSLFVAFLLF